MKARSGCAFARQLPPMQCDFPQLASGCSAPHPRSSRDRRAARLFCSIDIPPAALLPVARCSVFLFLRSGKCRYRSLGRRTGDCTLRAPVAGRLRAKKNHFLPLAAVRLQTPRADLCYVSVRQKPHCAPPDLFLTVLQPLSSSLRQAPVRASLPRKP